MTYRVPHLGEEPELLGVRIPAIVKLSAVPLSAVPGIPPAEIPSTMRPPDVEPRPSWWGRLPTEEEIQRRWVVARPPDVVPLYRVPSGMLTEEEIQRLRSRAVVRPPDVEPRPAPWGRLTEEERRVRPMSWVRPVPSGGLTEEEEIEQRRAIVARLPDEEIYLGPPLRGWWQWQQWRRRRLPPEYLGPPLRLPLRLGQWEDLALTLPEVGASFVEPVVTALPDWASAGFSLTEPLVTAAAGFPDWAQGITFSFFDTPTWAAFDMPSWVSEAAVALPELPSQQELTLPAPRSFPQQPAVSVPAGQPTPVPAPGMAPEASTFSWASLWKGLPAVLTAGASLAAAGARIAQILNPPEAPSPTAARTSRYGYSYAVPGGPGSSTPYARPVGGVYPPGVIPPNAPYSPYAAGLTPAQRAAMAAAPSGPLALLQQPGPLGVPVWGWLAGGVGGVLLLTGGGRRRRRRRNGNGRA